MTTERLLNLNKTRLLWFLPVLAMFLLSGCMASRSAYRPMKKYSPHQLLTDYTFFQGLLEESHPGLYWYTPKEEMDQYFTWGKEKLKDSMTEPEFRNILSYVISKIQCGHTAIRSSKQFAKFRDSVPPKIFPLSFKIWDDTVVVTANLNREDSILTRGTVIRKIDNTPIETIIDTLFRYISSDGNNLTHKYQYLSNRGMFGNLYSSVFGIKNNYQVTYIESTGHEVTAALPVYNPRADSVNRSFVMRSPNNSPAERRSRIINATRNLQIDSLESRAFMNLSSFGKGLKLRKFFRESFRELNNNNVQNLVIDVRGNGGGSVTNSTMLTRFIADEKFKVADSLYAINRNSRYKRHIADYFFNKIFMHLFTKKHKDGKFHFGYFERHYFKPRKRNHYNGTVYILTGGNSFSATTLFAQTVKGQKNVVVVGEETGGGAYGNTAWLIPDATLPVTGIRFRLPLFRLVVNKELPKDGKGVQPEVEVKPTVDAIRRGVDFKTGIVLDLIRQQQSN